MEIGILLVKCAKLVLQAENILPSRFIFEQYNKFYLSFFRRPFWRSASEIKPCFIFATAYLPTVNRFKQVGAHHFAHLA